MAAAGCSYSSLEIKNKLHNLTSKYREEKKKVGPSGGSPSNWNLYERVNCILGGFKFHNLRETVEESVDILYSDVEFIEDETGEESSSIFWSQSQSENISLEDDVMETSISPSDGFSETMQEQRSKQKKTTPKGKQKKQSIQAMEDINKELAAGIKTMNEISMKGLEIQKEISDTEKERNEILRDYFSFLKNNN
ncbi:uncharacterized protein [Musca autumnalis]|uniref:uncharacterized protein n=1 Tax=Musca autumnalis TaxID=221902 RepID=UPI003CF5E8EB